MATAEYEIPHEIAEDIKLSATTFIVQAILLALIGIVSGLTALGNDETSKAFLMLIQAILFIIMGVVFFLPSDNFRRISATEGRDITELMTGFRELNFGFLFIIGSITGLVIIDIILLI
ncbi:MAG: hypothetical protein ACXAD7_22305 [Candidatus Kariarchaeaceae archaeon]|jgi:hypothetical protein